MFRIIIVEDHKSMSEAIKKAFASDENFDVVAEIPNANLTMLYIDRFHPNLIIMDVCTEGNASGLSAAAEVKSTYPDIKVIIITAFDEISYLPRAKVIGADGFIYKSRSLEYFLETAKKVLNGEKCFPEPKKIPMPQGEMPLTPREMEVLRLICRHMTNKEIAEELFISENTVKYHKSNMLAKTGFKKTIDLAFHMITNGWINPLY